MNLQNSMLTLATYFFSFLGPKMLMDPHLGYLVTDALVALAFSAIVSFSSRIHISNKLLANRRRIMLRKGKLQLKLAKLKTELENSKQMVSLFGSALLVIVSGTFFAVMWWYATNVPPQVYFSEPHLVLTLKNVSTIGLMIIGCFAGIFLQLLENSANIVEFLYEIK